jgi:zinc D-Ala-D-Ala dipeptidase
MRWPAGFSIAVLLACSSSDSPGPGRGAEAAREVGAGPGVKAETKTEAETEGSGLADIESIAPAIRLDIRYASERNFTKTAFYPAARCLLRPEAAQRLARVQVRLEARGLGLKVWDCYRPFSEQKRLWALVPDPRYVAEPVEGPGGEPVRGSKHNRGMAVDLTLVDGEGRELEMPTDHDDFSERAHRGSRAATAAARRNAQVLEDAMVAEGFEPLPTEWWHFDAPGWKRAPLLDQPLR